jgi:hypothetical protein
MEDLAIACHARLKPIDDFLIRLIASSGEIFQALWPDITPPREVGEPINWLAHATGVVDMTTADTTGGSDRVDCGAGDAAIYVTRLQDTKVLPRFSPPIG